MSAHGWRDDDAARLDVHVVTHTHWDREWYLPAGRFRQRLVRLIDELLDAPDDGVPFLLDGQAIVLEDYLAVRPEREGVLAERLRAGTVEAGPWYVLADELIPSGEALVRNLFAGRRTLARLGAAAPPVLYCPDSFGHPAALPSLARGFGLPLIIAWRGYGGRRAPTADTIEWIAPDGAHSLLFHLPPDGYEFGASLPADPDAAAQRWERMRAVLGPRSATGVLLVTNGADHHAKQLRLDEAIAALQHAAHPARVERSSLREFAEALLACARDRALPRITGELRDSYGYTWALQGTFGTRAYEKRTNARVERLLLREAEPWSALAARRGGGSFAPLVHAAWRTLLECHPHDTLCGCSTDAVARAMDARLVDAETQARGIVDDAVRALVGHRADLARELPDEWRPVVLVRNAAPRRRGGVAELVLDRFLAHVRVGPGAPDSVPVGKHVARAPRIAESLGGEIVVQRLDRTVVHDRTESPHHYPDDDLVERTRLLAWVPPVPGYGIFPLPVQRERAKRAEPSFTPVRVDGSRLENGYLRVDVSASGSVTLATADGTRTLNDLLAFEDIGDLGDLYTHSSVGEPLTAARFLGARTRHAGPLRGEIELRWRLRIPVARTSRAPERDRRVRHVSVPLRVRLALDAEARFLRVHVDGENRARDHRLRIRFRSGIAAPRVIADAAFGPIERVPLVVPPEDTRAETPPTTAPLHRYVTLTGHRDGFTLVSDGLAEYEAMSDGTVAVTLLRAVGELSRNDLPERPGHAGWPVPTPGAQCPGPFAASFAVVPHPPLGDATRDEIVRAVDDVLLPLRGETLRSALTIPEPVHGATLHGTGLAFGTLKESEDGAWLVARCVNVLEREVRGAWELGVPVREAWLARLDETPLEPIALDGERVWFTAPARGIVTILLR